MSFFPHDRLTHTKLDMTRWALVAIVSLVSTATFAQGAPGEASRDWMVAFQENLQQGVLKFWVEHAIDDQHGGVIGRLDREGKPIPPGDKSLVIISRTMWSFAEAYRRYPEPAYREIATACLRFLRDKMWDKQKGGYYFMVSREGNVLDSTKLVNPMCYTMEGLAEYSLAFSDAEARKEAMDLFLVIDRYAHDDKYGGYKVAFSSDWTWLKDYEPGPNGAGMFGRKSYDWHLGLLEAIATLYDVTHDAHVRARLEELVGLFVDKIVDVQQGYGRYYFTDDWKPADHEGDSMQCEYGLDMEASWLMTEAAALIGRGQDANVRRASLALVDHTLRDGFDKENGGVYRTGPAAGPADNKDMEWWQQAEGLVALLNAYQMTGKSKYWEAFQLQARFVMDHFVDHQHGEWYTAVSHEGRVDSEKAGPWKAPYHVTRACLEIIARLGRTL